MGKLTPAGVDIATVFAETALPNNGDATAWVDIMGRFNISMTSGVAATVKMQCSFDGGTTALDCTNLGAVVTLPANSREQVMNGEPGCLHRLIRTSAVGPCTARLSQ